MRPVNILANISALTLRAGYGEARVLGSVVLALALIPVHAVAQVRVVVDGQVHEVPYGVTRTITYRPQGRQQVSDQTLGRVNRQGTVRITTTEMTAENNAGHPMGRRFMTRIEPIRAGPYVPPAIVRADQPPPFSEPVSRYRDTLEESYRANDAVPSVAWEGTGRRQTLRIRRDRRTGHFVAPININGVAVNAIIDTGAYWTILSPDDARATGAIHDITRSQPMAGIGGVTMLNVTRVRSMSVGGEQLGSFSAAIGRDGIPFTLLGQTEIARLGRIVIENEVMTIDPRK